MDKIFLAIATADSTAQLLRQVRKIRGLSIIELSGISGIHRNTISGIENGDGIMSARLSTLCKITHALNCDLRIELKPFETITLEEK